jgi:hypothetical protein
MGQNHTWEQEEEEEGGTTVLQYCDAKELVDGLVDFCTTRVSCCHVPCVTPVTTLSTCITVDFFFPSLCSLTNSLPLFLLWLLHGL